MPTTKRPASADDQSAASTFASRRAQREAAGAAPTPRREHTLRAGVDEPQPVMVVTRVQA